MKRPLFCHETRLMGILLFLTIFFPIWIYAQNMSWKKIHAHYYSGDYKTGMLKVHNLTTYDNFLDFPRIDEILFCGILCCEEYSKELQLQRNIQDTKGWQSIIEKQQEIWNIEVNFMEYLDAICDRNLRQAKDIKTKHHFLSLKIRYVSILASNTKKVRYYNEEKSLYKRYMKEVFPYLRNSALSVEELFEGYGFVLGYYAEQNNVKKILDCMQDYIEPWFKASFVYNNNMEKAVKLGGIRQYRTFLNILNYGLEAEFSPSNNYISSVMDLNIRARNMAFYINGNKMYGSHIDDGWQHIQQALTEKDIAIELCNAKGSDEHVFAFVIDKNCKYPRLEYCGHSYKAGRDMFGFSHLRTRDGIKEYEHIYYSTTEEMGFINTGQDKSLHRLHSLSELLMKEIKSTSSPEIYTFADINYTLGDSAIYDVSTNKGAERLTNKLRGAKDELTFIRNVIPPNKLHVFDLDIATKKAFKSISGISFDILHVSTHAYYDAVNSKSASNSDLLSSIEGISIMDNCGIKLSGYNDDKEVGLITATEIAALDLSKIDLVILDACETGTGNVRGGDLYSLSEAFHTAGVRYILATTSEVEDKDACAVLIKYISAVLNGNSYHYSFYSALQSSKSPEKYILWE